MCGIAGLYQSAAIDSAQAEQSILEMTQSLTHRGPDDTNIYISDESHWYFGHRRLSILDTSKGGLQPMTSHSGNLVITYNGEIYNHLEIRDELEKENPLIYWKSTSDTETLLEAFDQWGVNATLPKVRGMFSIALWDKINKDFYLIRDRFGEKPLYYGWAQLNQSSAFCFASELKAFKALPDFANQISQEALIQYFSYMYVPCPLSIYNGIYKLEPGCILKISSKPPTEEINKAPHVLSGKTFEHDSLIISKWYDLSEVVNTSSKNLFDDYISAESALESELTEVIKMQSLADVPLGAFLSGGIDSSLIVSLMQKQNLKPVKTFTIGFEDPEFDESPFAADVAKHLNTDHSELLVSAEDAQSLIPELPKLYDEPFADYSQIPTFFVSKAAKQAVTVSLSGDAGDEIFGGYNRYLMAPSLWKKIKWLPKFLRRFIGNTILMLPISFWDRSQVFLKLIFKNQSFNHFGDKVHKLAIRLVEVHSDEQLFQSLIMEPDAEKIVLLKKNYAPSKIITASLSDPLPQNGMQEFASRMMYRDTLNYMTDDILCKVDRAAMGVSLETRVPFLDHKIVELAWRMPLNMKIQGSKSKVILRNILYKHVPKNLIERPKAGFSIPLGDWLRGPLKEWVETLINHTRLKEEGFLDADYVQIIWQEHLSKRRNWTIKLWSILMFQSWLESTSN
jgi:asparagine synthase (glutamine-hydrolysing)